MNGALAQAPFDLVIFDVDGTLHDTFRWWGPVLRRGLAAFAERHAIEIPMPDDDAAATVVGLADAQVWGAFLPDAVSARWEEFRELVVPMELVEVAARDHLFDGVRPLLEALRAAGVRTALASNCRQRYLDGVADGQGLRSLTDWQFCLDSEGGIDKAGMLRAAMRAAGSERAVLVGDREPDRDAARKVGLPFVWRQNARCDLADADAVWGGDPESLLALLAIVSPDHS